ncbi:MAG: FMN-binding protein [Gammaproteobacteria bacterium]|nr:FMN-binding protein [Gammaproteobacteria bacterium]
MAAFNHLKNNSSDWLMLRALVLIATISGLLVVMSFSLSKPYIESNKQQAIDKALFELVVNASDKKEFIIAGDKILPASELMQLKQEQSSEAEIKPLYALYNKQEKLISLALQAEASGYQDKIQILYTFDPKCQCIRGIKVLKMAETPGIGDKISSDKDFLQNFIELDTSLNEDWGTLKNKIVSVKHGKKRHLWEIDSISGATISSSAVARMLNQSAQQFVPIIMKHLSFLQSKVLHRKPGQQGKAVLELSHE